MEILLILGGAAILLFLKNQKKSDLQENIDDTVEKGKTALDKAQKKVTDVLDELTKGKNLVGVGIAAGSTAIAAGSSALESGAGLIIGNPMTGGGVVTAVTGTTATGTGTTATGTVGEVSGASSGLLLAGFTAFVVAGYVGQKWYNDYLNSRDAAGDLRTAREVIKEQFNGDAFAAFRGISQGKISLNMYNRLYNIWRHILNKESKDALLKGDYVTSTGWAIEVNLGNMNSNEIPYIRSVVQIYLMQIQSKIDENSINPFAGMITSNKNEMLFRPIFNRKGFLETQYYQEEKAIKAYYGIPSDIKITL
jgi:hypothetical protein